MKIGIVGGLGPESTCKLYLDIINKSINQPTNQHYSYPTIIIYSVPMDSELERNMICGKGGNKEFQEILQNAISELEKLEADVIAIPCNTAHSVYKILKGSVPLINMVSLTAAKAKTYKNRKAVLLATSTTVESQVYQNLIDDLTLPSKKLQLRVDHCISAYLSGETSIIQADQELTEIINELIFSGSDLIILGCTDLSVINHHEFKIPIIDSLEVLCAELYVLTRK